ncbi:MAG: Gldg family protein [Deltaproteobacteria bacterium]|nr:Gldg family protein [Deltaproteobacteria bacterium]
MNRSKRSLLGLTGLVFLVFGGIVALFSPLGSTWPAFLELGIGVALIVSFLFAGGARSLGGTFAGGIARQRLFESVYIVLVLAILTIANVIVSRHELFRIDVTEAKVYTLAPESDAILQKLEHPLEMRGFFTGGKVENPRLRELLDLMVTASPQVTFQMIDPEKQPTLLEEYGISQANTLHLSYLIGDEPREAKVARTLNEESIINAVKKLLRTDARVVYYVFGHGEPDVNTPERSGYTFLRESIEGESIEVRKLSLASTGAVPSDAAALVAVAPKKPYTEIERAAVDAYLRGGGRAVFLTEPNTPDDLALLVSPLGIEVGRDVVVDELKKMYVPGGGLGVEPLIADYSDHPIVKGFTNAIVLATANSVSIRTTSKDGTLTEFARSSSKSWAERSLEQLFSKAQAARDPGDLAGPVPVAVAFEGSAQGAYPGTRLAVIGDSDFVSNANIPQLFNRDFFLNALNWVLGEERGISVRARSLRGSKKGLTQEEFSQVLLTAGILFPQAIVLTGILVWWRRRSGQ